MNVKGQGHSVTLAQGHWECPSKFLLRNHRANSSQIFLEDLCIMETKVYVIGPGHITKMAGMPIYGKNPLKIFF